MIDAAALAKTSSGLGRVIGIKSLHGIGSISAGSRVLTLASNPGFQAGDAIIVATGGEAGSGARGTKGVGGVYPSLSYASLAAMQADTEQDTGRIAWVEATGDAYSWNGSAWVARTGYYTEKAVPKALIAEVESVSGNDLTLTRSAHVAATSAEAYYDNFGHIGHEFLPSASADVLISSGQLTLSGKGLSDPYADSVPFKVTSGSSYRISIDIESAGGLPTNVNYFRLRKPDSFTGAVGVAVSSSVIGAQEAAVTIPSGWDYAVLTIQRGGLNIPSETAIVLNSVSVKEDLGGGEFGPELVRNANFQRSPAAVSGNLFRLPIGDFRMSGPVYVTGASDMSMRGVGERKTRIHIPNGCSSGIFIGTGCSSISLRDFTADCNFKNSGYGFIWSDFPGPFSRADYNVSETLPGVHNIAFGVGVFVNASEDVSFERVTVKNPAQKGFGAGVSERVYARNCTVEVEDPLVTYIQWMYQWSDCQSGGIYSCAIDSAYLTAGIEAFKSRGITIRDFTSINGHFASNSSDGLLVENIDITIKAMSRFPNGGVSESTPIMSFNRNAGGGFADIPSQVVNPTIAVEGYIDAEENRLRYFTSDGGASEVIITGQYPDQQLGTLSCLVGPGAGNTIDVFGANAGTITVSGVRIDLDNGADAIFNVYGGASSGSLTNSVVDGVVGAGVAQSGNITNAEYEAL